MASTKSTDLNPNRTALKATSTAAAIAGAAKAQALLIAQEATLRANHKKQGLVING